MRLACEDSFSGLTLRRVVVWRWRRFDKVVFENERTKLTDESFAFSSRPTSSNAPRFHDAILGALSKTRFPSEYAMGRR
ncbi:MAG: hypothetical protein DME76_01640 [Verrucomicrobia bacterium]|nr:MAG: hypothetical protein DME76_01640 [Verrucomicrobiota bacterium]